MDLLRFTTAGSVDDGKSTLIGRLLFDTKAIFQDQMDAVERSSKKKGLEHVDLSLLTDGLKDEREQGITIDVAYRYFATPKRKFIIADTPGHIQYTRNMITGASNANLAIILIDARKGVIEQTKRHSFIAALLELKHIVICVNKMDLVDYSEEVFERIKDEYEEFSTKLSTNDVRFIPISALKGDNVVNRSENMDWYNGATLMSTLEDIHIASDINLIDNRFPVQTVIRPHKDEYHDYRGYAGRIASGIYKTGDEVIVLPSGLETKISKIESPDGEVNEAFAPMSVVLHLEDDIDVSRGDFVVRKNNQPEVTQDLDVMLCWMGNQPFNPAKKYILRHTNAEVKSVVKEVKYKIDIHSLHRNVEDKEIKMNDICRVQIRTTRPLMTDSYSKNRITGSIILIEEGTNNTVAAGMIK